MYNKIKLQLSKDQIKKLGKGQKIMLQPHMIGKGVETYVPKRLLNKLVKASSLKKGCRIGLCQKDINFNSKKGGSFWGDVWGGIKTVGKEAINIAPDVVKLITTVAPLLPKKGKGRKKRGKNISAPGGGNIRAPGSARGGALSKEDKKLLKYIKGK